MCTPSFASALRASGPDERCLRPSYLTLMEAIEKDLAGRRIEEFYFARW